MKFQKREIPSGNGGNLFLRLKDGETVKGVLRGEIYEFYSKWVGGKTVICEPTDPEAKSRFRVNIVMSEDGKLAAKIWEFGLTIYNNLAEISDEYDIETTKLKITRRGSGTDTIYMILPLVKEPISPTALKQIEKIDLNMLEHKPQVSHEPKVEEYDGEDLPF